MKASLVPSGAQENGPVSGALVSRVGRPPEASTDHRSYVPPSTRMKAMREPSGDQCGSMSRKFSSDPEVSPSGLLPSAFIVQSCDPRTKTILEPSGDHSGFLSSEGLSGRLTWF